MLDHRYHIHVACTSDVSSELLDTLALFFEQQAFLTFDLSSSHPQAASYSHRCIEKCDYVLLLITDSYGELNNTGVSQLHLSYAYARTKKRPLLVLIKEQPQSFEIPQKLNDFIKLVSQHATHIHYFDAQTDLSALLAKAYSDLKVSHPSAGWQRDDRNEEGEFTAQRLTEINTSLTQPSTHKVLDTPDPQAAILASEPIEIDLDHAITLQYSAHAYAAGNLSEVNMVAYVRWHTILEALLNIPMPFSRYSLHRCLNSIVSQSAQQGIKDKMPQVHAVSRCQVIAADLEKVQKTLLYANLITLVPTSMRQFREMWVVTEDAKDLVKKSSALGAVDRANINAATS